MPTGTLSLCVCARVAPKTAAASFPPIFQTRQTHARCMSAQMAFCKRCSDSMSRADVASSSNSTSGGVGVGGSWGQVAGVGISRRK